MTQPNDGALPGSKKQKTTDSHRMNLNVLEDTKPGEHKVISNFQGPGGGGGS